MQRRVFLKIYRLNEANDLPGGADALGELARDITATAARIEASHSRPANQEAKCTGLQHVAQNAQSFSTRSTSPDCIGLCHGNILQPVAISFDKTITCHCGETFGAARRGSVVRKLPRVSIWQLPPPNSILLD